MTTFATLTKGTEKQIQYAEMIRQTSITAAAKFAESSKVKFTSTDEAKTQIAHTAIDNAYNKLFRLINATWWIENKDRVESKMQEWFMAEIKEKMTAKA